MRHPSRVIASNPCPPLQGRRVQAHRTRVCPDRPGQSGENRFGRCDILCWCVGIQYDSPTGWASRADNHVVSLLTAFWSFNTCAVVSSQCPASRPACISAISDGMSFLRDLIQGCGRITPSTAAAHWDRSRFRGTQHCAAPHAIAAIVVTACGRAAGPLLHFLYALYLSRRTNVVDNAGDAVKKQDTLTHSLSQYIGIVMTRRQIADPHENQFVLANID